MVERVEKLCELEGMFGQIGRFGRGDALIDDVRSFRSTPAKAPRFHLLHWHSESSREVRQQKSVRPLSLPKVSGIETCLAEDAGGAHHCVLRVRSGLAFEAERVFEIEGDDRLLRVLQHEVAKGADGDLRRDIRALGVR